MDELVSTLKSKGVATWLPDKSNDVKLIKHDGKAYVQFNLQGQQREVILFTIDSQATPNQST